MKNNFNLNIFFNELRNKTLSGNNVDIEDIINKANGNKDFIWKGNKKLGKKCGYNENDTLFFNPLFAPLELIFPILDKSLRCDHIFSVFTDLGKMADYEVCIEYVYLSSSKKEISFIIGLENGLGYLVKMFNKIKKKKFDDFPNLILKNYKTTLTYGTGYPYEIFLNGKYKWNLNYLSKVLDKDLKQRIKESKKFEMDTFNHNITIIKQKGKKAVIVKVLQ